MVKIIIVLNSVFHFSVRNQGQISKTTSIGKNKNMHTPITVVKLTFTYYVWFYVHS